MPKDQPTPAEAPPPVKLVRPEGYSPCKWKQLKPAEQQAVVDELRAGPGYFPAPHLEGID